jgi:hypothetical protein
MCQAYDDVREIDDDLRNGYFSLPISTAIEHGYNLDNPEDRRKATKRLREIARESFVAVNDLCGDRFPELSRLAKKMYETGEHLSSI